MAETLENPILNSPFRMPFRHWDLNEKGMPTGETVTGRRPSAYIVPIPQSKRIAGQQEFAYDIEGNTSVKTNDFVNRIRERHVLAGLAVAPRERRSLPASRHVDLAAVAGFRFPVSGRWAC